MTAGPIESSMCSPLRALDVCCFLYYFTSLPKKDRKVVFYSISAFLSTRVSFYGSKFKMDEHKYHIWLLCYILHIFIFHRKQNKNLTVICRIKKQKNVVFVCVSVSHCVCAHFSCQEVLSSLGRLSRCSSAVAGIPPETNSLAHSRTYLRLKKQRPAGDREKARQSAEGWRRSDK